MWYHSFFIWTVLCCWMLFKFVLIKTRLKDKICIKPFHADQFKNLYRLWALQVFKWHSPSSGSVF